MEYGGEEIRFAYPPVKGTHQECFEAINKDPELRPAEGLELALLAKKPILTNRINGKKYNRVAL